MHKPASHEPSVVDVPTSDNALQSPRAGDASLARGSSSAWASRLFWPALILAPAGVAFAVANRSPRVRPRSIALAALGAALGFGLVRWQLARVFSQQPAHAVEARIGELEIRRYASVVEAVTTVEGLAWRDALDEGFRRLAGYIFGDNTSREHISMTAPVIAAPGEKIEMTAPVTSTADSAGGLIVTFIMPEERSIASLPIPKDTRVRLRDVPPRRVAVLSFSGTFDGDKIARKQRELLDLVARAGLTPRGAPSFAGYDPPSTLPFLRRIEVWVDIEGETTR